MSEGTKNIMEGMKARGIRKVVGCLSGIFDCQIKISCFIAYFS